MAKPLHLRGGAKRKGGDALSPCRTTFLSTSPPLSTFVVVVEKEKEEEKREEEKRGGKNRENGGEAGEVEGRWRGQKTARSRASRLIGVNDAGLAVGESHPGAVLSDHDVELLLELRSEGYSYSWLAEKFEISKGTVAKICTGQRRAQHPVRWVKRGPPEPNLAPPGDSLCMDPEHRGANMALPKFSRIEIRPKVWVCMRCARRARAAKRVR